MQVLTFTNLYPSAAQPRHGIFIEHRVRQLVASGAASVRVVAPVPWVPRAARRLAGRYGVLAGLPAAERQHDIEVWRPRFPAVPRLSGWCNPLSMALAALPLMRRLQQQRDFDLIDAHFVYPDGAAAMLLATWLGKPIAVTARGTDINEFPRYRVPRAWIRWVLRRADALIGVSAALREAMLALGAPAERLDVLRNGVDLELFVPEAGRPLDFSRPSWLSVGHLIPSKGHHLVIEALAGVSGAQLVIVGDGPEKPRLQQLALDLGVADRIRWTGTLQQPELARHYARADVTVLASAREGMPNVLLESLACGTPVIATKVGGCAEIITTPQAGVLMEHGDAAGVVAAYHRLVAQHPCREGARAHAERFAWAPTVERMAQLFSHLVDQRRAAGSPGGAEGPRGQGSA